VRDGTHPRMLQQRLRVRVDALCQHCNERETRPHRAQRVGEHDGAEGELGRRDERRVGPGGSSSAPLRGHVRRNHDWGAAMPRAHSELVVCAEYKRAPARVVPVQEDRHVAQAVLGRRARDPLMVELDLVRPVAAVLDSTSQRRRRGKNCEALSIAATRHV